MEPLQNLLRIELISGAGLPGRRVKITLTDGRSLSEAVVPLPDIQIGHEAHESIRWYLEDFREFPSDPAPAVAERCAQLLRTLGESLFSALFDHSAEAQHVWAQARPVLQDLIVEADIAVSEALPVPLELLREPAGPALALEVQSFVHVAPDLLPPTNPPSWERGPIRILLIICRPDLSRDVPFRTIAARLMRSIGTRRDARIQVLRPPTYEQLELTLRKAQRRDEPFHLVHFDGHGVFGGGIGQDPQGFAVFEDPRSDSNSHPVAGGQLGQLLADSGVSALVLNACGSDRTQTFGADVVLREGTSPRALQLHSFGSLARNALRSGLDAVVAMRYNVYVSTAADFVSVLYARLLDGADLAESVTLARRNLAATNTQQPGTDEWLVPVIYQGRSVSLFEAAKGTADTMDILPSPPQRTHPSDTPLPAPPTMPSVGGDDLTITLDRAFDSTPTILMHGPAGAGKTTAAADFARWYRATAGVSGPVVYTSLKTTDQSALETARTRLLGAAKEPPDTATPASALWIWDDAEWITRWDDTDRDRLPGLLTDMGRHGVKTLITSTDGAPWLPTNSERIALRPLSNAESTELAARLLGPGAGPVPEALLHFSQGNPVVLRALCRHPWLRETTDHNAEQWLETLRSGTGRPLETTEAPPSHAITHELRAHLDQQEQQILSLLLLFRTNAAVVHLTAVTQSAGQLGAMSSKSWDYRRIVRLLDAVADLGWLTPLRADFYAIHPLLPCALRPLLDEWADDAALRTAHRAFTEHYSRHGHALFWTHQRGVRQAVDVMTLDQDNLLSAFRTALQLKMTDEIAGPMQALRVLYHQTSRRPHWLRLVESLSLELADPAARESLRPDLEMTDESVRDLLNEYLRDLNHPQEHTAPPSERQGDAQQQRSTARQTQEHDATPPIGNIERGVLRNEAIRLLDDNSLKALHRAVDLAHRSGDHTLEAVALIELGHWYRSQNEIRYDRMAHQCFADSLDLAAATDLFTLARALDGLGALHLRRTLRPMRERMQHVLESGEIDRSRTARITVDLPEEALGELFQAESYYIEALALFDDQDTNTPAVTAALHHQLGVIYQIAANEEGASHHLQQAIQAHDASGDLLRGAHSRYEFAKFLVDRGGRLSDALLYAERALQDMTALGDSNPEHAQEIQLMINWLRDQLA